MVEQIEAATAITEDLKSFGLTAPSGTAYPRDNGLMA